jgi:hypothetical protein
MGGLPGLSAIADVQSRIASIEARFGNGPSTTPQSASSPSAALTDAPDFATALANANPTASTSSAAFLTPQRTQFAQDLLTAIGAPQTSENVRAIAAWAQAEGTAAAYNPLATTRAAAGTTDFNGVGVKNYATYAEGVQATADTLRNGRYANILAALAQGTSAEAVARAVAQSPWGTGGRVLQVLNSNSS